MSKPEVSRYSRVSAKFWTDEKSARWSVETKLLALYVLTSPHRRMEGIFVLPIPYICADLGFSPRTVDKCLSILVRDGFLMFDRDTNVMLIRNALRYQSPENPNQSESCLRRIRDLPACDLLLEFHQVAERHCCRKGGSDTAKAFYHQLTELLRQRLGERFSQYLISQSPILESNNLKPKSSTSQARISFERAVSLHEERQLAKFPALKETGHV